MSPHCINNENNTLNVCMYNGIIKHNHRTSFHHLTAHVMLLQFRISYNKLENIVTITEKMM